MKPTQQPSLIRTVLPLASLTAVGMLATDLYLPAVPTLPGQIGGTLPQSQWTLASFMACLAISQLIWGRASDRYGENRILRIGMFLLLGASLFCGIAWDMSVLIVGRGAQGFGAGAATAVVPALLRKSFSESEAVKSISIVGIAESVVPALGPILGALLISFTSWRASFWIIAAMTVFLIPFVSKVTRGLSGKALSSETAWTSLKILFKDTVFLRYALSYAILFGALIVFVASAPQLISKSLDLPIQYFSLIQLLGVLSFMMTASQVGKWVEKSSIQRVLHLGALWQGLGGLALLGLSFFSDQPFWLLTVFWCVFCAGLGLRGPSTLAKSLASTGPRSGQASGLLMFFAFGCASAATAAVAPFLMEGLFPIALVLFLMTLVSIQLTRT